MSLYTTEVRFICEQKAGLSESVGFNDIDVVLDATWDKIFSKFPIFDESYRKPLCIKILSHYYTREICSESVGLWMFWLNTKMKEIMPYYNQLYKSEKYILDPFNNIDITTIVSGENTSESNSKSNDNSTDTINRKTTDKTSDTPQGGLSGIETDKYLTSASINNITDSHKNINQKTISGKTNGKTNQTTRITGKNTSTSYASLLNELRTTFLNIDILIINDLNDLFFNLY